jgi:cytochrome c oxidase subunit IV
MTEADHVSGVGYVVTFVALVVLASVSLLLSMLHWPVWGLVIALGIAVVKALLVLFLFMHLVEQRFSNRVTVLAGVMFVALLVGLTAADVATRHTFAARTRPPPDEAFYNR